MDKSTLEWVIKAARHAAEQARSRNAWNYDTVEVAANYAVHQAFNDFADLLQLAVNVDNLPEVN